MQDALGVKKLTVVETGGDQYQQEREQWDDANNTVALEPGVVVAYERKPTRSQRCEKRASRCFRFRDSSSARDAAAATA